MVTAKLLVFDMDGVLFNSSSIHHEAFQKLFSEMAVPYQNYEDIAGMRTDEAIAKVYRNSNKYISPTELATLTKRKREIAKDALMKNPPVIPGCSTYLRQLSKHYTLALASSSSRVNVEIFLNSLSDTGVFKMVLSGEDVNKAKPDPEIYNKVMSTLKFSPKETIVVEDSNSGIQAGLNSGAKVIALQPKENKTEHSNIIYHDGNISNVVEFLLKNMGEI